jgi:hypothetical protein
MEMKAMSLDAAPEPLDIGFEHIKVESTVNIKFRLLTE